MPEPRPAEPLDRARLQRATQSWPAVHVVEETGSTNADLTDAARAGAPHGTVLVAAAQHAGRGRRGRSWSTPAGTGLALSVLLRPRRPPSAWTWLPLLTGLGVADGLRALTGLDPRLKWPNDVLVDVRKLCGVLAERVDTDAGAACVVGLGVNVGQRPDELPVLTATSLAVLLGGSCPDREDVAVAVLRGVAGTYAQWADGDDDGLQAAYRHRSATLGQHVRVLLPDGGAVVGQAEAVDDDGRLVVATPDGPQAFSAGDVVHLRA